MSFCFFGQSWLGRFYQLRVIESSAVSDQLLCSGNNPRLNSWKCLAHLQCQICLQCLSLRPRGDRGVGRLSTPPGGKKHKPKRWPNMLTTCSFHATLRRRADCPRLMRFGIEAHPLTACECCCSFFPSGARIRASLTRMASAAPSSDTLVEPSTCVWRRWAEEGSTASVSYAAAPPSTRPRSAGRPTSRGSSSPRGAKARL